MEDYSKRELDEKFMNLGSKMDEKFNDQNLVLEQIREQTTRHNGRMSSIEKWQYITMGATSVITVVIVPILAWALWVLVNIDSKVHGAVDSALAAYNINP